MELGFNPVAFRDFFPIFQNRAGVYLDNAATTMTPQVVIDALNNYYQTNRTTIGRSSYRMAFNTTSQAEETRQKLAHFINLPADGVLIFCGGTTAAINIVAQAFPWQPGDNAISTLLEHNSNLLPWMRLADLGVELRLVVPEKDGRLEASEVIDQIDQQTRLIAITHTSNVLGVVPPVQMICEAARRRGILTLVDGAQALGHIPVDLGKLDCDVYAASAHKAYGPTGIGFLALSNRALQNLSPPWVGGGMVVSVDFDQYKELPPPAGWEAGTPPIAEILAWREALPVNQAAISPGALTYMENLTGHLMSQLTEISGITIWGPTMPEDHHGIVAFSIAGMRCHRISTMLDEMSGVMVRSGEHCAMLLHQEVIGQPEGTVRVSLAPYNTFEDIEELINGIRIISQRTGGTP